MSGKHHRVIEEWMGEEVETLADLLRPDLRAVCVGINPAPDSVTAGHYYQGELGQRFFSRLREAGVIGAPRGGWEDDEAFADGVGFTDIVKRPTKSATELSTGEYEHGRLTLVDKLAACQPQLVIFTFKKTATKLFGRRFEGNGFVSGMVLGASELFVMPGPYANREIVDSRLRELGRRVRSV